MTTTPTKADHQLTEETVHVLQKMEEKYSTLVWYARKPPASCTEYWNGVPAEIRMGALNAVSRAEEMYPDEIDELKEPDRSDWTHGFNSGMLAALRFVLTASSEEEVELEDGSPIMVGGLEDAVEFFPELDT